VGSETRINTYTSSHQFNPSITALSDGGYVITWMSNGQDGSSYGIYAQRYNASDSHVGSETLINTYTSGEQSYPSITALSDGGYVITWMSQGQDGSDYGIYAQRYNASGSPVGSETRINTYTNLSQSFPSITALSDGGYVITWQSNDQDGSGTGIYAKQFSSVLNHAPALTGTQSTLAAGTEDVAYVVTEAQLLAGFTDADNNTLSVTGLTASNGTLVNNGNGTYTITPAANFNGAMTLSYSVSDGAATTAATLGYTVTAVNDAPALTGTQSTLAAGTEDVAYVVTAAQLLAGFTDADNDTLSVINLTASNGTVVDYGDGTYTITPADDFTGVMTLSYGIFDGTATISASIAYQVITPLIGGIEFLVNTITNGNQYGPVITGLSDGGYVITWTSFGQDGSGSGIYAQRYNASGSPVGVETRINTYTNSYQESPSITALSDGGYVITWTSYGQDGSEYGIYAQRYNASGSPVGLETRINTYTNSSQVNPSITALGDGGYVITWTSLGQDGSGSGVYAQRFNASGSPVGSETLINTYTNSDQSDPSIKALSDGGYVITWRSNGQDGSDWGIYAQRFNASGSPVGSETLINTYTNSDQSYPSITALSDGGYVITWNSNGQDGSGYGIYAQRYNASGSPVGLETRINTYTNSNQAGRSITALSDGGYVISWTSLGQDGSDWGIYAQRYNAAGSPVGSETRINTHTNFEQFQPSITALRDGGYVITWTSDSQDGFGSGIYAKQFSSPNAAPALTGTQTELTAGTEDTVYLVSAAQLLAGFTDADNDTLSVINLTASNGTVVDNGDGTYTITPVADYNGPVTLNYRITDGANSIVATISYNIAEIVDIFNGSNDHDTMLGTTGGDNMYGGQGDDIYFVDNIYDAPLEGLAQGTDAVISTISWTLGDHIENLTLSGAANLNAYGNGLRNILTGNSGNNILDGRLGADAMFGGAGNDIYIIDNVSDSVIEGANEGADTALSYINYTLTNNVETLILGGTAAINGTGNGLQNTLYGNAGNNRLDGGSNYDTMVGGAGDDVYIVDHDFDYIVENANEGTDIVMSSVSRLMNDNLENLTLTGAGNINAYANGLNNIVRGNSGNNIVDGGLGADTLYGGGGNDIYYIDNAGDTISEQTVNGVDDGGIDWVVTRVDHTLVQYTEHMILSGAVGHINGTGNSVDNTIEGNTGNNILSGLGGNDTLRGFNGNDTLIGGIGNDNLQGGNENDTYEFGLNWGRDFITEGTGTDTIRFVDGITSGQIITEIVGSDLYYGFAEVGKTASQCTNWICVIGGAAGTVIENVTYGSSSSSTMLDKAPQINPPAAERDVSLSHGGDILTQAMLSFEGTPPTMMSRTQDTMRYGNQTIWGAGAQIRFHLETIMD